MNDAAPSIEVPAGSLHRRIVDDLTARIVSGEWRPGFRIPYEHELTAIYGCSRMTVNKALSQLAKSGLIERRRRSGSFVRTPRSQAAVLEITDIRSEVSALGLDYRYECLSRRERKASAEDAERLDVPAGSPVLALEARHSADGRPFCLENRLINLEAVPGAAGADFANEAAGPWLLREVPWSAAEHRISAVAAAAPASTLLDVAAGAACLLVERRTWSAERPVTQVRLIYPGDRHALVARFTPDGG